MNTACCDRRECFVCRSWSRYRLLSESTCSSRYSAWFYQTVFKNFDQKFEKIDDGIMKYWQFQKKKTRLCNHCKLRPARKLRSLTPLVVFVLCSEVGRRRTFRVTLPNQIFELLFSDGKIDDWNYEILSISWSKDNGKDDSKTFWWLRGINANKTIDLFISQIALKCILRGRKSSQSTQTVHTLTKRLQFSSGPLWEVLRASHRNPGRPLWPNAL